jgi:hypothetical protein
MLGEAAPPLVAEPEDPVGGPGGRERPKGALARLIAFARPRKARSAAAIMETRRDEMLEEAALPLIPEPEDPVGGSPDGRHRPKGALARLIAFARPRKAKASAAIMEAGSVEAAPASETVLGKRGEEDAGADTIVVPAAAATAAANGAELGVGSVGPATAAGKPGRPLFARTTAIAVVLMTGIAAAAIVVLNWPHGSPPQAVEPGMLADQPTKVMAPSAALARIPPREEPNVAGERPQVHETRRDEVQEVLSFKDSQPASPPAGSASPTPSPVGASVTVAKPADPTPDPPAAAGPTLAVSAPAPSPAPVSPVAGSKAEKVASFPPPASAPAVVTSVAAAPASEAQEPGLGEAAKIESPLGELEAKVMERSNATVTRADLDKAETQTSDQISRLAAIVTRLTGQVKDLQDQVRTESAGSEEKLADLTRRVSMSESKSAVAAAERANVSQAAAEASAATASAGVEGQAQGVRIKVAGGDQKRSYRIQAASPGLAMLSAIDGGPDDRPVEVAIGTDLPGYGKVRSIEQHGQAWVVKADRGSIE